MTDIPDPTTISGEETAAKLREILAKLEQQQSDYQAQIEAAKAAIAKLNSESEALTANASTISQGAESIRAQVESSARDGAVISTSATSAAATLSDLEKTRTSFEEMRVSSQTSVDNLTSKREELEKLISETESRANALGAESTKLQDLVDELEAVRTRVTSASAATMDNLDAISNSKREFDTLREKAQVSDGDLASAQDTLRERITETTNTVEALKAECSSLKSVLEEITQIKASTEAAKNSTQSDVQLISDAKQRFDGAEAQSQESLNNLTTRYQQVSEKINDIDAMHTHLRQRYSDLLEDRDVDGSVIKSVATQIADANAQIQELLGTSRGDLATAKSEQEKQLNTVRSVWDGMQADFKREKTQFLEQSKVQVDTLKTELENKILQLLPGAGAAGLASAYVDAKSKYGPTKFEFTGSRTEPYFWLRLIIAWLTHQIHSYAALWFYYAIFMVPLVYVAYHFSALLAELLKTNTKIDVAILLFRLAIYLPLLTISLFGWNSIRVYRRLYEEYNHKQRVMQLYDSFKKEIDRLGSEEQVKALLGVILLTVGDKPSLAMHKYDEGISSLIPQINLTNFASFLGIAPKTHD